MTHWHVVMLRVSSDGASGRFYKVNQVDIDYLTPVAAADVLVGLYERQLGRRFGLERRPQIVQHYADNPGMSTEPMTPDDNGDYLAILACEMQGEQCVQTGNAWGEQKIAMRRALGMW